MTRTVHLEPDDLRHCPSEKCSECGEKTRYWLTPHIPLCQDCAAKELTNFSFAVEGDNVKLTVPIASGGATGHTIDYVGAIRLHKELTDAIQFIRRKRFPPGTLVCVDCEQYCGPGTVVSQGIQDEGCPLDKVSVRLESGNTWWYPIDKVKLKQ
jgi:hypothetical protein